MPRTNGKTKLKSNSLIPSMNCPAETTREPQTGRGRRDAEHVSEVEKLRAERDVAS